MCYENERLEWLRRQMEKVEELRQQNTAPTPAQPAAPKKGVKEHEPVPV